MNRAISLAIAPLATIVGATSLAFGPSFLNPSAIAASLTSLPNTATPVLTEGNEFYLPQDVDLNADLNTELAQLPEILTDLLPPDLIPSGQFIQQMSELVNTVSDRQGQYALINASALANNDPNLLAWLAMVESSPFGTVSLNGLELGEVVQQLSTTVSQRDEVVNAIALQSRQEALASPAIDFSALPDLRETGPFDVVTQTISIPGDSENIEETADTGAIANNAAGLMDLYLPQPLENEAVSPDAEPIPVVVISHGVGGQRTHFTNLANHLASYGFAVVVPDHEPMAEPTEESLQSRLNELGEQLFGVMNPAEFIQRPQTISGILDELERLSSADPGVMGRLDTDNVGIIGHSLGGYTGLALASEEINRRQLRRTCGDDDRLVANLSLLLQCQARELPRRIPSTHDSRVKAVMALNPVGSAVLGEKQLADIDIPIMIVTGSHDAIAPMLSEQLPAFSWLTTPDKYLVAMVPGGHTSVNAYSENARSTNASISLPQLVTGPNTAVGGDVTQALSVAFLKTHLDHPLTLPNPTDSEIRPAIFNPSLYLTPAYSEFLTGNTLKLHLVTELVMVDG